VEPRLLTLHIAITCLSRTVRRFSVARRGDVAIIFALTLIPMLALTGAAIDLSRANAVKTSLQSAIDAAALMASKTAATQTSVQVQTSTQGYFNSLFTRSDVSNIALTASYSGSGGSSVQITAAADMATSFMSIFGIKKITITATSTAKWGSARLRVALVLDNTGSMASDGKVDALKTATQNLLTQLQGAATTNGDVYVSIIPFSRDVSVDPTSNYSASWIDWTEWSAAPANSVPPANVGPGDNCPYSVSGNGFTCSPTPTSTSTTNTIPSSGTYKGYICPAVDSSSGNYYNGCYNSTTYSSTGSSATCSGHSNCSCSGNGNNKTCKTNNGYYEHAWVVNATSTWNGCITDRGTISAPSTGNYDQNVIAPTPGTPGTLYPADQYSYCTLPIMGLSYNWSAMSSLVNQMTPNGATNQPIGLVWGWLSLVGGGPLTAPAQEAGYTYTNVIILLSDGLNTQDRWYGNGSATSTQVDARMYNSSGNGTCANIKAAGIVIYTIQVNTGGDPTSTLLRNCATDSGKFFLLTSANQIITTFNTIGTNLTKLRIAQ
jgi:Flp pilus assembly protein TadG